MRRLFAVTAFASLVALPALADIHPMYHEQAKAAAASVAVVDVLEVSPRDFRDGMGRCVIEAQVAEVERGEHLVVGDIVALEVDCHHADAQLPASPMQWLEVDALASSTKGRVWLNADGSMLARRYYQIVG